MRRWWCVGAMLLTVLLYPYPSLAQDQAVQEAIEKMSVEDRAKLMETIKSLNATVKDSGSQKNMAGVLDKALDLFSGAIIQVSQQVKNVAPEVWRIMLRQQYAKAIGGLVVPWGVIFSGFLYMWAVRRVWRYEPEKDESYFMPNGSNDLLTDRGWAGLIRTGIPFVIIFLFLIFGGISSIRDAVYYLVNPEYYAVRDLVTLLLDPSRLR